MTISPAVEWPATAKATGQWRAVGRGLSPCPLPHPEVDMGPCVAAPDCSRATRGRLRRSRCRRQWANA
eukprot:9710178-Lingulodinium_polyedra.AAC.1